MDFVGSSSSFLDFDYIVMVSQELPEASGSGNVCQFSVSETDSLLGHSENFSCAVQWNGGSPNNFGQISSVPPSIHSLGGQICPSINRIQPRGSEDLGIGYGHGHGLSLTLSSHLLSDLNLYNHKEKCIQGHVVPPNYAREDQTKFQGLGTQDGKHDCMFGEDKTTNSYFTSKPSYRISRHMAPSITTIQNSRYLKPIQQLLDEVVCVSNAVELASAKQLRKFRPVGMTSVIAGSSLQVGEWVNQHSSEEKPVVQNRINKLVPLLDELESRYEHYFNQMDNVVSSFEVVTGKGAAASYTALTIQAMYRHFLNLREAIVRQIYTSRESGAEGLPRNHGGISQDIPFAQNNGQKRGTPLNLGMMQHRQVWRPLRGLPENSVALLRDWLFEHFLHPYPSDNEKLMLASRTGLTKIQISNWFINARVRLWKPMIEEMYRVEFAEDS